MRNRIRGCGLLAAWLLVGSGHAQDCVEDAQTLCLVDDQFAVTVEWRDSDSNLLSTDRRDHSGAGQAIPHSDAAGFFALTDPGRGDILIKILDGRGVTGAWWVFASAATTAEFSLRVRQVATGLSRQYANPLGRLAAAITDTQAFGDGKAIGVAVTDELLVETFPTPDGQSCMASETIVCLRGGRFGVDADFVDFDGAAGFAQGIAVAGGQSAAFAFSDPDSPDLLVSVIDGTHINDQYWYAVAPLSDLQATIRITDFLTGEQRILSNPLGVLPPAVIDVGVTGDTVNRGHSGFWFNPQTSGQGVSLELHPGLNRLAFMAMYAFDIGGASKLGAADQRWITGQGSYAGRTITMDLFSTTGGRFNNAQATQTTQIGTATMTVESCQRATLDYDLGDEGSGSIRLERLLPQDGGVADICVALDLGAAL